MTALFHGLIAAWTGTLIPDSGEQLVTFDCTWSWCSCSCFDKLSHIVILRSTEADLNFSPLIGTTSAMVYAAMHVPRVRREASDVIVFG